MKIVMLCDFYNESLTYQENLLALYYVKHGHVVTVITSVFDSVFDYVNDQYDRKLPERTYYAGAIKIIKLPYRINFLNRVRFFRPLDSMLQEEAPDLILVHDIMFNLPDAVRYINCHPNARLIMDYHADYSNSGKNWLSLKILHGVIRKRVLDKARPYLQRIFPIVPASTKFLHEIYKVPHEEMELLPLGADLDMSHDVQASEIGISLRQQYGIPNDSFVVFTGGKLTPAKRTEMLIEAFLLLELVNVWLVVIGDSADVDASYIRRLREMANGCTRIVFTGWLNARQVLEYLDMADIAVFPASQSILWQQAIGMNKPLIIGEPMAQPGGDQDVSYLNLYENIILLEGPQSDAVKLADAMRKVISDPIKLVRMTDGARRVATEILDWNKAVANTLRFNMREC
jgi:1,2-diacylglycerol 3-alpha-glucosyltransferase